ncbi:MAG: aconitate hydratase AcnA [Verrucomicrobia bacterium]|nr:aconitate hydratase AcnA [Verrucomicrobiota bacterium]
MSTYDFTRRKLSLSSGRAINYFSVDALEEAGLGKVSTFPYSIKILIESLIRLQEHPAYAEEHVTSLAGWQPARAAQEEFPYLPSRVLLQDFTGVPCVVDLAALRSAVGRAGMDPSLIEPQIPVDLVIDHSVQVDEYGSNTAYDYNLMKEFERNKERYTFLKWGQQAFRKLSILPPGLGICHQVNMEYLASCVASSEDENGQITAFPDTLVGTDSHTPMVNAMGVLGWGVGGIEAEAAMLGQPIPLLTPVVTGVRLTGEMPAGCTPTDLALMLTEILRAKGVVGQFVEFFGPGLDNLSLADRAPVANMAAEYGATMGFFPIDSATLEYLRITGRPAEQIELVEAYCRAQGLFRTTDSADPVYSSVVEFDLAAVEPSVAGPRRPQDRIKVQSLHNEFEGALTESVDRKGFGVPAEEARKTVEVKGRGALTHGSVVIAAITSCTNTSNPGLMLGAGIVARKAVEKGLTVPGYVKTSLAPGSRVVSEYLKRAGLLPYLSELGFQIVAYGCTTCIGNSGPLPHEIEQAIKDNGLVVAGVLSGNRNFEGRIHPLTRANYLCSPLLVVAYALRGNVNVDLLNDPVGTGKDGSPVYLKDLWPTAKDLKECLGTAADPEMFQAIYSTISASNPAWNDLSGTSGGVFEWEDKSTYIREPTFFEDFGAEPPTLSDVENASVLGLFGDFITTDHISPAGAIPLENPASSYLQENGVQPADFNSFGSRRGNHEVMMRGTFANIRIRNKLVAKEGGRTVYHPTGEEMWIYDAAMRYKAEGTPLVVVGGKMYGAGSSRDWAAKGTFLLGVKAVIAESFERIHRSNLVEMGVLPLEFMNGETAESLGITGREQFSITGIAKDLKPAKVLDVTAATPGGEAKSFKVLCRIDTPIEVEYYLHGGILQYVLRDVMSAANG